MSALPQQTEDCIDGNNAACHVAYGMSEACFIYPITPSSGFLLIVIFLITCS